jgi:two-component system, OmpR family, sensor histidine kinase KdpD
MAEDRAGAFLRMIRSSQRGRLKVYLGYSAGVGKTHQMLQEGHRLKAEGIDVVIGLLETHGREGIIRKAQGLEEVPRRRQEYHGIAVEEMDVDAVLARKPQVALIDELAHTNVPGSRNGKRYEDIQDILAAGIHVITTMNVQHLESLYNIVENAVGVKVRERIPDSVLAEADQIIDIDLATEDLRTRLEEGKIYPPERIETALANFFVPSNLEKLRELTLRELASQIDLRRRETKEDEAGAATDQIMVGLSSHGPNSERLLRFASRLAGKLNRNWYAVYVQTPSEEATVIDAQTQRFLSDSLTLAKQLGAMVFTYKGEDIVDTLLRFAREYRVGHIVVGKTGSKPIWKRLGKNKAVIENLIRTARGINIIVVDTDREDPAAKILPREEEPADAPLSVAADEAERTPAEDRLTLGRCLTASRVLLWSRPVSKNEALMALALAAGKDIDTDGEYALWDDIMKREEQGSTFFNEGVAFPHVRVPGLKAPLVAAGLTQAGVSDVTTEKPIEIIFLLLSPAEAPEIQVQLLGLASRAAQNRRLLQILRAARTAEDALEAVLDWESSATPNP